MFLYSGHVFLSPHCVWLSVFSYESDDIVMSPNLANVVCVEVASM